MTAPIGCMQSSLIVVLALRVVTTGSISMIFQNDMWRSYNDDRVEPVDEKEIFEREANQVWPKTSTGVCVHSCRHGT